MNMKDSPRGLHAARKRHLMKNQTGKKERRIFLAKVKSNQFAFLQWGFPANNPENTHNYHGKGPIVTLPYQNFVSYRSRRKGGRELEKIAGKIFRKIFVNCNTQPNFEASCFPRAKFANTQDVSLIL